MCLTVTNTKLINSCMQKYCLTAFEYKIKLFSIKTKTVTKN